MKEGAGIGNDAPQSKTRGAFRLEKWYVDTLLEDGSILIVYLGRLHLLGIPLGRVTAQFFPATGACLSGSAKVSGAGGSGSLEFGAARMVDGRLSWSTPGLSGELCFVPRHNPPAQKPQLLAKGGCPLNWQVEIPDADVHGEIHWPEGRRSLQGRGYRDRVWFDFIPWPFPIRELFWGRAAGSGHAAFWTEALTDRGRVRRAWADGRMAQAWDIPEFHDPRVILDSDVAALDSLRLGPLRPLLQRLTGNPHEVKYAAATRLGGEPARAIFEKVVWP